MCLLRLLGALALIVSVHGLTFPGWAPETPLRGSEASFAGLSVALSDRYAVAGVPEGRVYGAPDQFETSLPPKNNGHVVYWERPDTLASTWPWSNNVTLTSDSRLGEGDLFGTALSLREGLLLVGSPHYAKHGAAFLFDLQQRQAICKFRPGELDLTENATSIFGFSVALSSNYIAIGNPTALDKNLKSTVHVYSMDLAARGNCTFVNLHKIELPEQSVQGRSDFGFSLAIAEQDDTAWLAIGARYYFPWNSTDTRAIPVTAPMGAVFVYTKKLTDKEFTLQTILQDISFQYGDSLGSSLSFNLDGTILAVGAVQDSAHTPEAGIGKVVLYQRTNERWKQQGSFSDANGQPHDHFGSSVAFQKYSGSNLLAVGSLQNWRQVHHPNGLNGRGAVFVYSVDINGGPNGAASANMIWFVQSNSGPDNGQYGSSVGFSTTNLIVGAPTAPERMNVGPRNETLIPNCGIVWVYDNNAVSSLPGWTIAVIVTSSVSFVVFIIIAIACLRLRAQRRIEYETLN